jgi:hypothetical protein
MIRGTTGLPRPLPAAVQTLYLGANRRCPEIPGREFGLLTETLFNFPSGITLRMLASIGWMVGWWT